MNRMVSTHQAALLCNSERMRNSCGLLPVRVVASHTDAISVSYLRYTSRDIVCVLVHLSFVFRAGTR
jgi:hypothetical protein